MLKQSGPSGDSVSANPIKAPQNAVPSKLAELASSAASNVVGVTHDANQSSLRKVQLPSTSFVMGAKEEVHITKGSEVSEGTSRLPIDSGALKSLKLALPSGLDHSIGERIKGQIASFWKKVEGNQTPDKDLGALVQVPNQEVPTSKKDSTR